MKRFDDPNFSGWMAATDERPMELFKDIHRKIMDGFGDLLCWFDEEVCTLNFRGMDLRVAREAQDPGHTSELWLPVTDREALQVQLFDLWEGLRAGHRVTGGILPGDKQDFIEWKQRLSPPEMLDRDAQTDQASEPQESGEPKALPELAEGLPEWASALRGPNPVLSGQTISLHAQLWIVLMWDSGPAGESLNRFSLQPLSEVLKYLPEQQRSHAERDLKMDIFRRRADLDKNWAANLKDPSDINADAVVVEWAFVKVDQLGRWVDRFRKL